MDFYNEYKKCESDVVYFVENHLKIELYPCQRGMLWNFQDEDNFIVNSCRQSGKSLMLRCFSIWYGLFHNNKRIALMSMSNLMSENLRKSISQFSEKANPEIVANNRDYIKFRNNSSIHLLSSNSLSAPKGHTFDMFGWDEMAYSKNQEEIMTSIYPTLSRRNSKIILTSTKNGENDFFHHAYIKSNKPNSLWKSMCVNWWDIPGRDREWKQQMINSLGQDRFNKEFCV